MLKEHYRHPSQVIAAVVGLGYIGIGVIGFAVTGFNEWIVDTNDAIFGFHLNGFHNIVHLGVGAILLAASIPRQPAVTQGVLIGGGLVYILAAVLGFFGLLDNLLSVEGGAAPDNFLHLVSGAAAIGAGFLGGDLAARRIGTLETGEAAEAE